MTNPLIYKCSEKAWKLKVVYLCMVSVVNIGVLYNMYTTFIPHLSTQIEQIKTSATKIMPLNE